ncbi:hypothetical protein FHS61_001060 [Altererythrobacter atlanticus]|uniref:Uncharacterized protein n=1 Tax=Croceibacterium atlanticum TaxID=1267766 RepID=A0A0F7KS02_9SPHN|nr:hypothetical protein [Croceibacterium atlanticum]AKH43238.1 hypothetical protein WYH_02205 [Croceibacterium atlanticum]MBB5732056.1 hypothetical protein [Croceibacterium atlanticum]
MRKRPLRAAQRVTAALLLAAGTGAFAQTQAVPPLSDYFTPAGEAPTTPDKDGFIGRWLLLEPIEKPNPTNTVFTGSYVRDALAPAGFPGEFGTVPEDGEAAGKNASLRWHALDSKLWDVKLFNFAQALGKPKYGVLFWAVTVVESPREIKNVRMAVGSNSASIWWIDGQEVATLFDDRRMVMDDVLSDRLTLKKGRNVIYGAIINGPGLSDFCIRFLDESGEPVRDLEIDVK